MTQRMMTLPAGSNSLSDIISPGSPAGASVAAGKPAAPTPAPVPQIPKLPDILATTPTPQAPATIPTPDATSPAIMAASQAASAKAMGTAGRSATILSRNSGSRARTGTGAGAGMGDYSRSTLAAG